MKENLILLEKPQGRLAYRLHVESDFMISRYPVSVVEFDRLLNPGAGEEAGSVEHDGCRFAKRATWMEAVRYCNLLSLENGLAPAYDEDSGAMIDETGAVIEEELRVQGFRFPTCRVKGFRLPTATEWEYAAEALFGTKGGFYLDILHKTHELPMYGSGSWEIHDHGLVELDKLELNAFGLYGMLGNAHEWYSDNKSYPMPLPEGMKNKMVYWEDYITNYNNDISFMVKTRSCGDSDATRFRVALTVHDSTHP